MIGFRSKRVAVRYKQYCIFIWYLFINERNRFLKKNEIQRLNQTDQSLTS